MEEAFIGFLLADSGITAICGSSIHWNARPQAGGTPAAVLHRVANVPQYHAGGASGLVESRLQIDCYATTYSAAKNLARAVEARISGIRATQGVVRFNGCFITSERDDFEAPANGSEKLHRVMLDVQLWHSAAS